MYIIRHTKLIKTKERFYISKCKCGCEFVLRGDEFSYVKALSSFPFVQCPECDEIIKLIACEEIDEITYDFYTEKGDLVPE